MKLKNIPINETGYFNSLICDYVNGVPSVNKFFSHKFDVASFQSQIDEKKLSYNSSNREYLVSYLKQAYLNVDNISDSTTNNINLLSLENTFTVTTGHQLNLFTGPLYFLYKIINTIKICEELKELYPSNNFVPIYWMASEDHDFLEINHFTFKGKKVVWNKSNSLKNDQGAVGEFDLNEIQKVFNAFSSQLDESKASKDIRLLFKKAYIDHDDLASAMFYLVNELFSTFGLVILDANTSSLKKLFVPYMIAELQDQVSYNNVLSSSKELKELNYKVQVNPREINLFYKILHQRNRIIGNENGGYSVVDSEVEWTNLQDLISEIETYPDRFSPNVLLRPLYQEVILPNLCYVGGGGELSYWLQLKTTFKAHKVSFPILKLRNSALLVTNKQFKKIENLNLEFTDLFLDQHSLINYKVRQISDIDINFSNQINQLNQIFASLEDLAKNTDASFNNAVEAQKIKQLKGLKNLEKRLLKAQKRKLSDHVSRLVGIKNELFLGGGLQERKLNFSEFHIHTSTQLLSILSDDLEPFSSDFQILLID